MLPPPGPFSVPRALTNWADSSGGSSGGFNAFPGRTVEEPVAKRFRTDMPKPRGFDPRSKDYQIMWEKLNTAAISMDKVVKISNKLLPTFAEGGANEAVPPQQRQQFDTALNAALECLTACEQQQLEVNFCLQWKRFRTGDHLTIEESEKLIVKINNLTDGISIQLRMLRCYVPDKKPEKQM